MMFADLITYGNQVSKHHKNSCKPHSAENSAKLVHGVRYENTAILITLRKV
jgi:hypothetical protein